MVKTLSEKDYKLLVSVCQSPESALLKNLTTILSKRYSNVIASPQYVFAEGSIPVLLLAHVDTVFSTYPENIFYDTQKNVMWSPEGLGADDRAGVFAILKIIDMGLRPSILFTTGEESGGIGVRAFCNDYPSQIVEDLKFAIQLDRRGDEDCIFYRCGNKEFQNFIEKQGFTTDFGTFTDISTLCPKWDLAGVNLSIGYFNEHFEVEYLKIGSLFNTIEKVVKILKYVKHNKNNISKYTYQAQSYLYFDSCIYDKKGVTMLCNQCQKPLYGYDGIDYVTKEGSTISYCDDCFSFKADSVNWCIECYFPFESNDSTKNKCVRCEKKRGIAI